MIQTINRDVIRMLRAELELALAAVGEKHGIKINVGNASFTSSNVTFKVEAAIIGEGGVVINKEAAAFKALAVSYGLLPDDLGKTFTTYAYGGGSKAPTYEIIGAAPRSFKFPILGKRADGKIFKFPPNTVIVGLGRKVMPAAPLWNIIPD
jgi:hypothetical protein